MRRGDTDAARDAATAIARHDNDKDAFDAFEQALYCTAEVASADAAEAIVRMLAAQADFSVGLSEVAMYKLIAPHGGRLMAAFCEAQPDWVESLGAADSFDLLCLWMACESGSAEAAWRWLCGVGGIAPAPLGELLLRHWTVNGRMLASVSVLLRRAVALSKGGVGTAASGLEVGSKGVKAGPSGVEVGAVEAGSSGAPGGCGRDGERGRIGARGGSNRDDEHGSSGTLADGKGGMEDGSGKDGGDAGSSRSSLPSGMQQLTAPFLTKVLWSGYPDVLHAMLDFVDCWNPSTAANQQLSMLPTHIV